MELKDFKERLKEAQIHCPLCSFSGHSLIGHLQQKHSLSPGQYKEKYPENRLVSPVLSEMLRKFERRAKSDQPLEEVGKELLPNLGEMWVETLATHVEKKFGAVPDNLKHLIPKKDLFYKMPAQGRYMGYAVSLGKNCYVEGPTGCGKSELAMQLMSRLSRPIKRINMHGDVTAANFIGQMRVDKNGTYFFYGSLPNAMKEGYTLLCDEIDFTPPHIAAVLHPVCEGTPTLHIPDTGETILAKKGFQVIGIGNTGGKGDVRGTYTGTEVLNSALLDRFHVKLKMDYLESAEESAMLVQRYPREDLVLIDKMVKLATEVRLAYKQGKLATTFSTRKLVEFFEAKVMLGQKEALDVVLLNWMDEEDEALALQFKSRIQA